MKPPNILLLITDQQRAPRHWPDEPGWLEQLMPNDAELARTGVTFTNGFCNSAMCSPSRATLFTGRFPAQHGVTLTLTAADLKPDPRNTPAVVATMADILRRHQAPAGRVLRGFTRGLFRSGPKSGHEPELPSRMANLATLLHEGGYTVAYKGKWHLTHPSGGAGAMLGGWTAADAERIERDYGFGEWEAPDAGENAKASNFGGGNAGEGEGWDEVYTRQVEQFLGRADLPEPFCLVVSLVNPHDVLGYPASYLPGGYEPSEFRDLGVDLPPTIDEDLSTKPAVQSLMRMGMAAYLGPLSDRRAQLDYVNFYAHLHRVVDAKIGRLLTALGSADDPGSLRSRTVIVRCADHGEMGLAHGGLRQKAFNVYEETINVPLVVSNPVLFRKPARRRRARVARRRAADHADARWPRDPRRARRPRPDADDRRRRRARARGGGARRGRPRGRSLDHPAPAPSVQDAIHFTYDDHQAGDRDAGRARAAEPRPRDPHARREVRALLRPERPGAERVRALRPRARSARDPTTWSASATARRAGTGRVALRAELAERLDQAMAESGTAAGIRTSSR